MRGLGDAGYEILRECRLASDRVDIALSTDRIEIANRGAHRLDRLQTGAPPEEFSDTSP